MSIMNKKVADRLNEHIQAEFSAAYIYLSMAAYFDSLNLKGFAKWMGLQAQEEIEHGMRIFNYTNNRGGRVILQALSAPRNDWGSPLEAFEEALHNEQHVTRLINEFFSLAEAEKDRATTVFLHWFVTEQVEEEASVFDIIQKLKLVKSSPEGLLLLDRDLGNRKKE